MTFVSLVCLFVKCSFSVCVCVCERERECVCVCVRSLLSHNHNEPRSLRLCRQLIYNMNVQPQDTEGLV